MTHDTIIHSGRWFDGTGAPSAVRNIGIRDGHVVAVTPHTLDEADCPQVVDAMYSSTASSPIWSAGGEPGGSCVPHTMPRRPSSRKVSYQVSVDDTVLGLGQCVGAGLGISENVLSDDDMYVDMPVGPTLAALRPDVVKRSLHRNASHRPVRQYRPRRLPRGAR